MDDDGLIQKLERHIGMPLPQEMKDAVSVSVVGCALHAIHAAGQVAVSAALQFAHTHELHASDPELHG
jgi:hypothetical protein